MEAASGRKRNRKAIISDVIDCTEDGFVEKKLSEQGRRGYDGSRESAGDARPITRSMRKWLRRRSAIEPITGHLKSDNRMDRNFLRGEVGDKVNALLCGCGANIRKLIKTFFLSLLLFTENMKKMLHYLHITSEKGIELCIELS